MKRYRSGVGTYLPRIVDRELDVLLSHLPAISLEGAKGVGKTATALRRAVTAIRLDDAEVVEVVRGDPSRIARGPRPILVDEWQRFTPSFDVVRRAVDDGAPPASFLLTGSPPAPGTRVHSGAGRVVVVRMRPLSLAERGVPTSVSLATLLEGVRPAIEGATELTLDGYVAEILGSGFPGAPSGPAPVRRAWLDGYVERIIDREVPELGRPVPQLGDAPPVGRRVRSGHVDDGLGKHDPRRSGRSPGAAAVAHDDGAVP